MLKGRTVQNNNQSGGLFKKGDLECNIGYKEQEISRSVSMGMTKNKYSSSNPVPSTNPHPISPNSKRYQKQLKLFRFDQKIQQIQSQQIQKLIEQQIALQSINKHTKNENSFYHNVNQNKYNNKMLRLHRNYQYKPPKFIGFSRTFNNGSVNSSSNVNKNRLNLTTNANANQSVNSSKRYSLLQEHIRNNQNVDSKQIANNTSNKIQYHHHANVHDAKIVKQYLQQQNDEKQVKYHHHKQKRKQKNIENPQILKGSISLPLWQRNLFHQKRLLKKQRQRQKYISSEISKSFSIKQSYSMNSHCYNGGKIAFNGSRNNKPCDGNNPSLVTSLNANKSQNSRFFNQTSITNLNNSNISRKINNTSNNSKQQNNKALISSSQNWYNYYSGNTNSNNRQQSIQQRLIKLDNKSFSVTKQYKNLINNPQLSKTNPQIQNQLINQLQLSLKQQQSSSLKFPTSSSLSALVSTSLHFSNNTKPKISEPNNDKHKQRIQKQQQQAYRQYINQQLSYLTTYKINYVKPLRIKIGKKRKVGLGKEDQYIGGGDNEGYCYPLIRRGGNDGDRNRGKGKDKSNEPQQEDEMGYLEFDDRYSDSWEADQKGDDNQRKFRQIYVKKIGSKELQRFLMQRDGKSRQALSPFHHQLSAWK